jgi:hypothetical protein
MFKRNGRHVPGVSGTNRAATIISADKVNASKKRWVDVRLSPKLPFESFTGLPGPDWCIIGVVRVSPGIWLSFRSLCPWSFGNMRAGYGTLTTASPSILGMARRRLDFPVSIEAPTVAAEAGEIAGSCCAL